LDPQVFTYQTRLNLNAEQSTALNAYADLFCKIERKLFVALYIKKLPLNDTKRQFLKQFQITSRQYNAIKVQLEGRVSSIKERKPDLIEALKIKIQKAEKVIEKLASKPFKQHQKKRRLAILKNKLSVLEHDLSTGRVRICFGSKKLFRQQFNLEKNGFQSHEEWLREWQKSRSEQFFVLGSKDETAGNQSCAAVSGDGGLTLRLRLPDALAHCGKYISIPCVNFAYGQQQILAALASSQRISTVNDEGKVSVKRTGTALSYRFLRDDKGWRVFASLSVVAPELKSSVSLGAIGIDVNAKHLAVAEINRHGNWLKSYRLPLNTYGKSTEQAKALIGDVAKQIAKLAVDSSKPVVVESLNFQRKKAELEKQDGRYSRMLSSFAYGKTLAAIKGACFRAGVEVREVNPAFTSVIGAVKFSQKLGLSVHQGAALAIARRGLGLSEIPPRQSAIVPVANGGHVTLSLPERDRHKHVWSAWGEIRTKLRAAHVAHFRRGINLYPLPLRPVFEKRVLSTGWNLSGHTQANRDQHCSDHVFESLPF